MSEVPENKKVKQKKYTQPIKLKSISDVLKQLSRTYTELQQGNILESMAKTRAYILNIVLTAVKDNELEIKMNEIEKLVNDIKYSKEDNRFKNVA